MQGDDLAAAGLAWRGNRSAFANQSATCVCIPCLADLEFLWQSNGGQGRVIRSQLAFSVRRSIATRLANTVRAAGAFPQCRGQLAKTCSEDTQRFHINIVSSDLILPNAGWQDVEATLTKVRACGDGFAEFVIDQLSELERLSSLLEQRQQENDAERRQLDASRDELQVERESLDEQRRCLERDAEQIEANSQRLEKGQADLEEARAEFARLREASAGETGTATTALLSQLESVERERDELAQQLASATAKIGRLADVTAELAEVRAELLRQPERLAAETQTAIASFEQRLSAEAARRSALEEELTAARAQIARLTDAAIELADVRAELAEARAELLRQPEQTAAAASQAAEDLCRQLAELEQHRTALEQELAEARQQISRLADANAELAKLRGELEEARLELLRKPERSNAEADSAAEDMCHRLAEIEQQRSALEQELSSSRSQISRLVDATAELAAVRGELAAARAELLERPSGGAGEGDQVWRERLREMQHEREMLEAELETVRRRVVEMAETAASEKQRNSQERTEWSKEFKQLRKLLEVQAKSPAPKSAAPVEAPAPVAQTVPSGGDPILESVMAQFDMLQKDIARRRSNPPKSTKK